jgi:hypothetical protein
MASFTDTQAIEFNPYIQQIPVDDYVRVGMMKQQQYNEGIQRVQNYFDTISGLPVVGEANKQLLASKLGELRTKIRGALGADFSKMNLQMQVGNLAAQVAKDPAITNAVETGRMFQAAELSINEARKSGKGYSSANEAYLRSSMQNYLKASEKEAGLRYNGPTNIHSVTEDEVHKKIQTAIAPLKGMEDIDYTISDNGKIMLKNEDKILDATRIKAAIEGVLTADDRKALSIGGWYNTYGMNDQQLVNEAGNMYNEIGNRATSMADYYQNLVLASPNMSEADKARYKNIADQHKQYAKQYYGLSNSVKEDLKNGKFNREDVAGLYWRERIENNYAGAYQFRQMKQEKEVSPEFEVWYKENDVKLKEYEAATKRIKEENEARQNAGLGVPIGVDPNDPKYKKSYSTEGVQQKIAELDDDLNNGSAEDKVLMSYAKSLINTLDPNSIALSGLETDLSNPSGFRWKSKADKDKIRKLMNDGIANYTRASIDPNFTGTVPLISTEAKQAHFENIEKATISTRMKESDEQVAKQARGQNPNLFDPKKQVSLKKKDGTSITMSIGDIAKMVDEGMTVVEAPQSNLGGGLGGSFAGANKGNYKRVKEGSKLDLFIKETLGEKGYGNSQVQKIMGEYGIDINKEKSAKDKIYKTWGTVINPRMRNYATSDKQKNLEEYSNYQNVVSAQLKNVAEDADGNSLPDRKPNPKDINIEGAFRDVDGTLKMQVSFPDKDKGVIRAYVDVTDFSKSASPSSWLGSRFVTDTHPELTEVLRRPGATNTTAFNEDRMFQGSLFVTGNDKVARKYMIAYDKNLDTYKVVIAVPEGNGRFRKQSFGPPQGFPHAGAAISELEYFYSNVSDKVPINLFEQEAFKNQ